MKKRYLYALLFIIPAFLISLSISPYLYDIFFELYETFGPSDIWFSEMGLLIILAMIVLVPWIVQIIIAYWIGLKLEDEPKWNRVAVLIMGFALVFSVYVLRFLVGYAVESVNGELCGEYCQSNGYHTSIISPYDDPEQTCYCSNGPNSEHLIVPLDDLK